MSTLEIIFTVIGALGALASMLAPACASMPRVQGILHALAGAQDVRKLVAGLNQALNGADVSKSAAVLSIVKAAANDSESAK